MVPISRSSHSELYGGDSQINKLGTEGLYAMADKSDADFMNAYDVSGN